MADSKASFFRQGAWMVVATILGGVGMTFVQGFLGAKLKADDYNQFKLLLGIFYILGAPQSGIWTMFAQQTAMAVTPAQTGAVARAAWQTTLAIAGVMGLGAIYLVFRGASLAANLKLEGVASLWATWGLMLATLWLGIARGILQGRQDFFSLGWVSILDGVGRAACVVAAVLVFHTHATGAILGALAGNMAALVVGVWAIWPVIRQTGTAPPWRQWLGILIPLTIVAGALQTLSQFDLIFLRGLIPEDRIAEFDVGHRYIPAQIFGFALTQFTVPLAMVMFPKVARSRAIAEKSDALKWTILATAILGGLAALGLTLIPWLPLRILFPGFDPKIASPLVPWMGWAMLAYTIANVFVGSLLAHGRYRVVAGAALVAVLFVGVLKFAGPNILAAGPVGGLKVVVLTVAGANLLLLAIAGWFSRATRSNVATLHSTRNSG